MPLTVAASHGDAAHPETDRRVSPALLALDEHLFNPDASQWLLIDAGNQAVPRTTVPSLRDGLDMVGIGRVAALVGHLRDGVGVVDVDVPGEFGDFLTAEIVQWLDHQGCWVLQRPSGGAAGRCHVFFAHPEFHFASSATRTGLAAAVGEYLVALAADVKVPRSELDLRNAVRTLTSPHRRGAITRPHGDLREALRTLKRVVPDRPEPTALRARSKVKPQAQDKQLSSTVGVAVAPPMVLQRWKRQLRAEWRHYLMHAEVPEASWAAAATRSRSRVDVDRSLVEASCTRELVWAIGEPSIAWTLIRQSHPRAMTKAKHHGYSWWLTYVWNKLVRSAGEFITTADESRQAEPPATEIVVAVAAARDDLSRLMWTVPVRRRAALLLVGHHLLDRALRENRLRTPCPERDLQLDTGLSDRKTIRAALALLNGRLGTLHTDCLSRIKRDSTSYEFELNAVPLSRVRQIPPPVFDPPQPARGLWATLPRGSHSLWRALVAAGHPLTTDELTVLAGQVDSADCEPSKSQRSTARAALVALSKAGLARADAGGRWRAAATAPSMQTGQEAAEAYTRQFQCVEAERAAYRAQIASSWTTGRARAIKAAKLREKAWWNEMSPATRAARRAAKRLEFDQMSITQQAALKAQLAERRGRAGIDEFDHHRTWLRETPADEYLARSLERTQRFQRLSPAERGASIAAWHHHRLRYGLIDQQQLPADATNPQTKRTEDERAAVLPHGPSVRDATFLERQETLPYTADHRAAIKHA